MENSASRSSCVSPAAETTMAAGESSWAMHMAEFVALSTQKERHEMGHQGGVPGSSFSHGFSSSLGGDDDDSFITSGLMCEVEDDEDEEEDDSLKDTACSPAAGPKETRMNDVDMKSMITMDAKAMNNSQLLAKYFANVGSWQQSTDAVHREVICGDKNSEKQLFESNDLRKKGLCLVPLSMLIDYLG